jgi:AcrR family transcriptional regulator
VSDQPLCKPVSSGALRADARRNREKIEVAAHQIILERGVRFQMEEVAARADVGIGTLYRNYPSKEDLIAGVVLSQIKEACEALLRIDTTTSPWVTFATAVEVMARQTIGTTIVSQQASLHSVHRVDVADAIIGLQQIFATFVERAQEAGELRTDTSSPEILELIVRVIVPRSMDDVHDPRLRLPEGVSERFIDLILRGLRPDDSLCKA